MFSQSAAFLVLTVAFPVVITELLLRLCWCSFGERGAYPLVFQPSFARQHIHRASWSGAQGFTPLPLSSALFLSLRRSGGEIVWLYGLPEIFRWHRLRYDFLRRPVDQHTGQTAAIGLANVMATTPNSPRRKLPRHLWVVGILSLLWEPGGRVRFLHDGDEKRGVPEERPAGTGDFLQ